MNVALVLVNYFKEEELVLFTREYLLNQGHDPFRIIIVDNGSNTPALLHQLGPDRVTVLPFVRNLGYFGAARVAYDFAVEYFGAIPDFFIVSNFDLSFEKKNFLHAIVERYDSSTVGVVGPSIVSSLNSASLNPIYKTRISRNHLRRIAFFTSWLPLYKVYQWLHYLKRKRRIQDEPESEGRERVYAVHGSFIIFTKLFFEKGGTLNYESFLYGEEIFIAEQALQIGLAVELDKTLHVIHHEHVTTGEYKGQKHMEYLRQSIQYLRRKYFE